MAESADSVREIAARIEHACKVVLTLRSVALLAGTASSLAVLADWPAFSWLVIVTALTSLLLVVGWGRFAESMLRHPLYLAVELTLALAILTAAGADGPFFFFTLGSAALGGLLYRRTGALVCAGLLAVGYVAAMSRESVSQGFLLEVGMPVLYFLVAVAAASARELLDREHLSRQAAGEARAAAATERERARLAREMHDSLGKMLYGLAMSATVLAHRADGDSVAAARLATDARAAAERARELVSDLREELPGPVEHELANRVEAWRLRSGLDVDYAWTGAGAVSQMVARELVAILDEALANVHEHARATRARVAFGYEDDLARLSVEDDGVGFVVREDEPGHYGVRGMRERARLVDGRVTIDSRVGSGTAVVVHVPTESPRPLGAPVVLEPRSTGDRLLA